MLGVFKKKKKRVTKPEEKEKPNFTVFIYTKISTSIYWTPNSLLGTKYSCCHGRSRKKVIYICSLLGENEWTKAKLKQVRIQREPSWKPGYYFIYGGWVRSPLIRRYWSRKEGKGTSHEDAYEKLFQGQGMVSAKALRPKYLGIFSKAKRHCGWSNSREIINEVMGHSETGDHWRLWLTESLWHCEAWVLAGQGRKLKDQLET